MLYRVQNHSAAPRGFKPDKTIPVKYWEMTVRGVVVQRHANFLPESKFGKIYQITLFKSDSDKNELILIYSYYPHQDKITQDLSHERRDQWIANIKRDSVTNGDIKYLYACSLHFQEGKGLQL